MYSMIEYNRYAVSKIKPQLGKEAREVQGVMMLQHLSPVSGETGA